MAVTEGLPQAESKLRLVLDYLPCEACLSQPVRDQDLLCSICRRLDRDVEVVSSTRAFVLIERPSPVVPAIAVAAPPLPPPVETDVPAPAEAPAPVEPSPEPQPAEAKRGGFSLFRRKKEEAPAETSPAPAEPAERPPVSALEEEPAAVTPLAAEPAPAQEPPAEPPAAEPAPVEPAPAEAVPEPAPAERAPEEKKRGFSLFRRKKAEEPAEAEPAKKEAAEERAAFDDAFDYVPGPRKEKAAEPEDDDDVFTFTRPAEREPARPAEAVAPLVQDLEDDFLYKPPGERVEERPAEPEPLAVEEPAEDLVPREEAPVETPGPSPWAPEEDPLAALPDLPPDEPAPAWPDEAADREPMRPEESFVEMEIVADDEPSPSAAPEEGIVETEIVEMEVLPDDEPTPPPAAPSPVQAPPREPEKPKRGGLSSLFRRKKPSDEPAPAPPVAPAPVAEPEPPVEDEVEEVAPVAVPIADGGSDLARLRGFLPSHAHTLARQGIEAVAHLSGHDPHELADRTGIDPATLATWIHVADLVQDVNVPIDAAVALVAAGVEGPRGLRTLDAETIADRVAAFGGDRPVSVGEVKRWKRRAQS